MLKVFVVDDEPTAVSFIRTLVQQCPGFEVVGTAANGRECLAEIDGAAPDVVVTDIHMPIMDGVVLARRLREEHPQVMTLVVSGYQEFEYVRDSLRSGVYDYLLKPLTPAGFTAVFARLRRELEQRRRARRNRMLRALSKGKAIDPREMRACFPEAMYDCVLVRRNGLPRRFTQTTGPEIYSESDATGMSIFGRDERERICLRPAAEGVSAYARQIIAQEEAPGSYITAVITGEAFPMEHFELILKRLFRVMDLRLVPGRTQAVFLESPFRRGTLPPEDTGGLRRLEHYLRGGMAEKARQELRRVMLGWEAEAMPQMWLERQLRHILHTATREESGRPQAEVEEYLLEDAFDSVSTMDGLIEYMTALLFGGGDETAGQKLDSPETFEQITGYIRERHAQALTLQAVGRRFGISQSYVSKMFRRYAGSSFTAHLTRVRMEQAIRLLEGNADLLIKDVAALVGYSDPFYFSRAFRAYTGVAPSDYMQKQHPTGGTQP